MAIIQALTKMVLCGLLVVSTMAFANEFEMTQPFTVVDPESSSMAIHAPSRPSPLPSESDTILHASSYTEEAFVWASRKGCQQVVQTGGRMAVHASETLRVGTWNIRWFSYGQSPHRSRQTHDATDVPWLACTIAWMNLDVLAVQESLDTVQAKRAWQTILASLQKTTGHVWRWSPQPCGKPENLKVGFLWNTRLVELTQIQSLWPFNVKARSTRSPCEGALRPGHYAYVQSRQPPGSDFHIIALHLKSGPTVAALADRHRALNRIDHIVSPLLLKDQDIVILGDFNTMGAGDQASRKSELKHVRRMVAKEKPGFDDIPLTPRCSHYFRGRDDVLDHVLVSHDMAEVPIRSARVTGYCVVAECRRINGKYPLAYQRLSDHCPVVINIVNQDQD